MPNGAKQGQIGPDWVKQHRWTDGVNKAKEGQTGLNGAKRSQTRPNGVKRGQAGPNEVTILRLVGDHPWVGRRPS